MHTNIVKWLLPVVGKSQHTKCTKTFKKIKTPCGWYLYYDKEQKFGLNYLLFFCIKNLGMKNIKIKFLYYKKSQV